MSLENKIVIVTGAGSGIGAATAKLFAAHKATVVVSDIHPDNGQKVVQEITDQGGHASFQQTDVRKLDDVEKLINDTCQIHGRLDVMVNNAGIGNKHMAKTADYDLGDWDNVVAVNQTGVFYCMRTALQKMVAQGSGNIVNIASLAGLKASGHCISYSASKFAVVGMTKSAALEYASKNIRINCVCPGYTHSALFHKLLHAKENMDEMLLRLIPMKRFGQPEEIAEAVVWLASDKTSFITGQAITLDGGLSL
ncbi:MAG: SDR family NAD(P)-dependent oxidoreductase [Bacteroidota bacterium]